MARRVNAVDAAVVDGAVVPVVAPKPVSTTEEVPAQMKSKIEVGEVSRVVPGVVVPAVGAGTGVPEAPKQWRVVADAKYVSPCGIGIMRAGKILDELQYDIDAVRAQGVKLVLVEA